MNSMNYPQRPQRSWREKGAKLTLLTAVSLSAWALLHGCGGGEQPFSVDQDGDGWPRELDCDDTDPTIFPSADDIPDDGVDQDCSGSDATERGLGGEPSPGSSGGASSGSGAARGVGGEKSGGTGGDSSIDPDRDGDGFPSSVDCDDDDPRVHPGAFDVPWDGVDQDCSGADSRDGDGDGFDGGPDGPDCDDTRREVFPGAIEIINNRIDENCDGSDLLSEPTVRAKLADAAVVASAPDISLLPSSDELLVVWVDARRGDPRDIVGQRFDLEGERLGAEITISNTDPHPKTEVRLFPREDGFLVTWITEEGGFARQLGPSGEPSGIALGIAEAGATGLRAAFGGAELEGGGTWGLVWLDPLTERGGGASFRALTLDGIRSEVVPLARGEDQVFHVALSGTNEGFFPVWDGTLEGARGLVATRLDRLGESLEDPWLFREGLSGEPTLLRTSGGYSLVFRAPENVGHVASLFLDEDFELSSDTPARLSADSALQTNFRIVESATGWIALWSDGRHLLDSPAVEAIYGQNFAHDDGTMSRAWGMDRAIFAGIGAELGGAVWREEGLLVAVRVSSTIGWMIVPTRP